MPASAADDPIRAALDYIRLEPNSLAALQCIEDVRYELELLEELRVAEARAEGASWDQIARRLAMTRQGAWKKHRPDTDTQEPTEPTVLEALDEAVEELESRVGPPAITDDTPPRARSTSVDAYQSTVAEQITAHSSYFGDH